MSTALATVNGNGLQRVGSTMVDAFEPRSIEEGITLSKWLHASGLLPKNIPSPEAAFAIIVAGRELGFKAMTSLRSIKIVSGNISVSADGQLAICLSHPEVCEYFEMVETTPMVATYRTKRRGHEEVVYSFTMDDAAKAGLSNSDTYKKHPKSMLRARCISHLTRMQYADLVAGVYEATSEEIPADEQGHTVVRQDSRRPLAEVNAERAKERQQMLPAIEDAPAEKTQFEILDETETLSLDEQQEAWRLAFAAVDTKDTCKALETHYKSRDRAEGLALPVSVFLGEAKERIKGGKK